MTAPTPFFWRKLCPVHAEDAWIERLAHVADRLAITALAGQKTLRLEVFHLTRPQADALFKAFGGQVAPQKLDIALQPKTRAPILVRQKLVVASEAADCEGLIARYPGRQVILIPAGMAFGTGDHATTATCLRLLSDVSEQWSGRPWEMLDLGCGTAILAIAARLLGAKKAEAVDFDPDAVRVSKENVKANALGALKVGRLDVREWTPMRTWQVVVANMFSGVLIEAAPKIAAATAPGGNLVFSGVLREQEPGVVEAFQKAGFRIDSVVRKGKWITGAATRLPAA